MRYRLERVEEHKLNVISEDFGIQIGYIYRLPENKQMIRLKLEILVEFGLGQLQDFYYAFQNLQNESEWDRYGEWKEDE